LQKLNKSLGALFQTLFLNFLFLTFLSSQIDLIILKIDDEQFTLTTKKNHCISPLTAVKAFMGRMSFLSPNNSVKALTGNKPLTQPMAWPHSLFIPTRLTMEGNLQQH